MSFDLIGCLPLVPKDLPAAACSEFPLTAITAITLPLLTKELDIL